MVRREVAIFVLVGTMTIAVDFVVYWSLASLVLVMVDVAKGIGFLAGTTFAYFANRFWTFKHKPHAPGSVWRFALLYTGTLWANIFINTTALNLLHGFVFAVHGAFLLATGASGAMNFLGMKFFVFRKQARS